ncbi:MAG: hypothetical protein Q8Q60_00240 [Candidatus Chromulinivorax sp.]|nr:hypothetical protein [Candidatus Chromulinivorax sp.]
MKSIAKLLVFGLLMQHGVANASWIFDDLLGGKQAQAVKYAGRANRTLLGDNVTDDSNIVQHYHTLREGAEYLEKRKNAIEPWATLGLACLCYQKSNSAIIEENFYEFLKSENISDEEIVKLNQKQSIEPSPNGYMRPLSGYTSTYENITWQFDREQKMYQNRIVAATGVVIVSAVAGYLLANKK